MAEKAKPNNGIDPDAKAKTEKYVGEIERANDDWSSKVAGHMKAGKEHREVKASIIERAERDGLNAKALKAIIRERELKAKILLNTAKLDIDEQARLEAMREHLGEFASTPLGAAAMAAAASNGATAHA